MHSESQPASPHDVMPFKPLQTILEQEMEEAEEELERPAGGLFLSGVLAGIGVGFSVLLIAAVLTSLDGEAPAWIRDVLVANAYTVGFILVIPARTDLFTEYTTIAILPVLHRRKSVRSLARLWALVYLGNLVGTLVIAAITVVVGPALDVAAPWAFAALAEDLVRHDGWTILLSSILAAWLMGLLSWLVTASRETVSQLVLIWLVTGTIGYAHLHHAVTGSAEVLAGIFVGGVRAADFGHFLAWTTLGNSLGGIVFAGLIHHSALLAAKHESRGLGRQRAGQSAGRRDKSAGKAEAKPPRDEPGRPGDEG